MIKFFYFLLFLNFLNAYNTIHFMNMKNIIIFNNISKVIYNDYYIFNLKNNPSLSNEINLETKKPLLLKLNEDNNDIYSKILNIYDYKNYDYDYYYTKFLK